LFLAPLFAGFMVNFIRDSASWLFRFTLVFTGAFFLGITVLHVLPEAYHFGTPFTIGIFILVGYVFQIFIEVFTSGVEHGHLHSHHHHRYPSVLGILIALCIHSLLEGSLLSHEFGSEGAHGGRSIFSGLLLHKMTAAFALATIIYGKNQKMREVVFALLIFSTASPVGWLLSDRFLVGQNEQLLQILYALVAGSFLQISTTIFFESTPEHEIRKKNLLAGGIGMSLAILAEWLLN
jgi:zinc transporter ZupT